MGDHEGGGVWPLETIDGIRHIAQRINVQTRVDLIKDSHVSLQTQLSHGQQKMHLARSQSQYSGEKCRIMEGALCSASTAALAAS